MEGITKDITIRPSTHYPDIYRIPTGPAGTDGKQYFLIENRKKTGFDSYIPGEGLMVLHIDENQKNNNDQEHYLVDIEQCDGRLDLNKNANRGDADDLFPSGSKDAFSADTYPSSRMYGGNDSGFALRNIRRIGEDIVLDISAGAVHTSHVRTVDVYAAARYCSRKVSMNFAHCGSRWAWAYVSDIGWRRINIEN
jgi:immune inhibitor A